jgi:hypothetical protein
MANFRFPPLKLVKGPPPLSSCFLDNFNSQIQLLSRHGQAINKGHFSNHTHTDITTATGEQTEAALRAWRKFTTRLESALI